MKRVGLLILLMNLAGCGLGPAPYDYEERSEQPWINSGIRGFNGPTSAGGPAGNHATSAGNPGSRFWYAESGGHYGY